MVPAPLVGQFHTKADPASALHPRGSESTRARWDRSLKAERMPSGLALDLLPRQRRGAPTHLVPTQLWAPTMRKYATMRKYGPSFKKLSASRLNLARRRRLLRQRPGQRSSASSPKPLPSPPLPGVKQPLRDSKQKPKP